ncbi:S49 family peptidase [Benzoatithermus flavus]|uniref:S49 family peptidase n=1 Tax=Benzoatithermus flavus TaxID=3108223 RepID=A0ABU8XUE9_9PROT
MTPFLRLAAFWRRKPVIPVLRLSGVIGQIGLVGRGMTLGSLERAIDAAFAVKRAPAVALLVNSPGGSPVQAAQIAGRIRDLADEKKRHVIAFVEDVAASGGYWLACAADEIFTDASSIVGSIGVVSAGFGFQDAIRRLGIERRVHTAGKRKALLDPFQPERPEDLALLQAIQRDIHQRFIAQVRERRGDRLKGTDEELFDGRIWTGAAALEQGLIDGLGEARATLRARFGKEVRLVPVNPRPGWLWRRLRFRSEPAHMLEEAFATLEARALWARFGL